MNRVIVLVCNCAWPIVLFNRVSHYGGPQLSQQNQKPHGKNKTPHGKTENLTAKTKYLTTKPKLSRQNQRPHGKTKYFTAKTKYLTAKANTHGKTEAILFLLWSIWFCRDVFGFAVRYFVFAVRFLWFCRDVFGFAVRFLVLPWQLWATIVFDFVGPVKKDG